MDIFANASAERNNLCVSIDKLLNDKILWFTILSPSNVINNSCFKKMNEYSY